jgi:hypothetical protein
MPGGDGCAVSTRAPCADAGGREPSDAPVWVDAVATDRLHIDVRGLPPPLPLVRILELVRRAPAGAVIIVHHERDPLWLYPELAGLGWSAEIIDGEPGELRLRLTRGAP